MNRDTIASIIGEGVHTSLRRFCESYNAHIAWRMIRDMPDGEWDSVCQIVAREIIKAIEESPLSECAQDSLDLFLQSQERAKDELENARSQPEKSYWQGVKDGLRKCYAILSNNPKWQAISASSNNRPPDIERI